MTEVKRPEAPPPAAADAHDARTSQAPPSPTAMASGSPPTTSGVHVVLLSGLSGSGKTTALHALEDVGFFCIDNLPSALMRPFLRLSEESAGVSRVALSIDVRERLFDPDDTSVFGALEELERQGRLSVLYLESDEDVLVARFKTTRRPHPLVARGLASTLTEAFAHERRLLAPLRARATMVIDTTDVNVHDLRKRIVTAFGESATSALRLAITSFGFRNGLPPEADFVFDVRYLDNPYFVPELRDKTGLDPDVAAFVLGQETAQQLLAAIAALVELVLPQVEAEGRASLTLAIGCTGGHHRSVAMAVALRERLSSPRRPVSLHHRDVPRPP